MHRKRGTKLSVILGVKENKYTWDPKNRRCSFHHVRLSKRGICECSPQILSFMLYRNTNILGCWQSHLSSPFPRAWPLFAAPWLDPKEKK